MLRAIVFDLDGVIINSEPLMRYAFALSYRQVIGDGEPPIEAYLEHMGESFPRIMEQLGLPLSMWQPYREICQQHIDRIALFPGSRAVLEWARSWGLKTAILTGKDRGRTLQVLNYFHLDQLFDAVITSDQLRAPKPDSEGMLLALQMLGCRPEEVVMVGDAVSDILCAQRAHVAAIAVTWGIKPERVQTLCDPDYIVHTWEEFSQVLLGLYQNGRAMHPRGVISDAYSIGGLVSDHLLNDDSTVLGLDIGGTQVRAALARGRRIVASRSTLWPTHLSPLDEVHFAADLALNLVREAAGTAVVRAAGVSLAALLDQHGTVVQWPNRPAWRGLAFQPLVEARLGVPTVVEDDANAAALAEWTFGAAQGYQHVLVMMVGTGIGAGLILDGRLFRGRQGWAGELGHVVVQPDGPACSCGHLGCLQMVASGRALERAAAEHHLPCASALTAAAEQGEAWACQALAASAGWLGLAAANVVNLLDVEAVVVGGGLSTLGAPWWQALKETFHANLLNMPQRHVALRRAALPDTAGLLGAIGLAWQVWERNRPSLKEN